MLISCDQKLVSAFISGSWFSDCLWSLFWWLSWRWKKNLLVDLVFFIWDSAQETYPGLYDQDVLNRIKYDSFITDIGLRMRFLNTSYFGDITKCVCMTTVVFFFASGLEAVKPCIQSWEDRLYYLGGFLKLQVTFSLSQKEHLMGNLFYELILVQYVRGQPCHFAQ